MARVTPEFDPAGHPFCEADGWPGRSPGEPNEWMDRSLAQPRTTPGIARDHDGVMVSFTAATSWLSVKGLGRNANC